MTSAHDMHPVSLKEPLHMPQTRQESLSTQLAHTQTPAHTTWHAEAVEHVFAKLGTSEKGLTTDRAKHAAVTYGWNELPRVEKQSPVMIFLKQFASPLILILVLAAGISAAMAQVATPRPRSDLPNIFPLSHRPGNHISRGSPMTIASSPPGVPRPARDGKLVTTPTEARRAKDNSPAIHGWVAWPKR